jgi:hypothetical protein
MQSSKTEPAEGEGFFRRMESAVLPYRNEVIEHPIYGHLDRVENLRPFMEDHVFAVWDFMTLLKSLQSSVTCVGVAWQPIGNPKARRLINEIVLGEETDEIRPGEFSSHLELYIEAMEEVGACTESILTFLEQISEGLDPAEALKRGQLPETVQAFSGWTWRLASQAPVYEVAAAFMFGREDLVPNMFRKVLSQLGSTGAKLRLYMERHIELDEGQHGPMAKELLCDLCGDVDGHWIAARNAAIHSLRLRKALWDGVAKGDMTKSWGTGI